MTKWGDLGWGPFTLCGPQIGTTDHKEKPYTVGFLGFGRIAQATLRRLAPFGITRCIYTNTSSLDSLGPDEPTSEDIRLTRTLEIKHVYAVPLSYLAKESDLVIVLAPGGRQTHHIVDKTFLKAMKATSVLVNTSRGTLVDTDALVLALQEKWIWGAGLDVIEGEPHIKADHPLLKQPRYLNLILLFLSVLLDRGANLFQGCSLASYRECHHRHPRSYGESGSSKSRQRCIRKAFGTRG